MLAGFLKERRDEKSKYEDLKATLPVANDCKAAVINAIEAFKVEGFSGPQAEELYAQLQVRVLHWMRENPTEAVDFLISNPFCNQISINYRLAGNVFIDVAEEKGVLHSLDWLTKSRQTMPALIEVMSREMKAGGGLALFEKLHAAMAGNPFEETLFGKTGENLGISDDPFSDPVGRVGFFSEVGRTTPFSEKEKLLDLAMRQTDDGTKSHSSRVSQIPTNGRRLGCWILSIGEHWMES